MDRYQLKVVRFQKTKDLLPYVNEMFDLLNQTYHQLQSFVPIQNEQVEHYKKKYFQYIDPRYVVCVADSNDKLIAFSVIMPQFSKALKKANGSMFPFGLFHIIKASWFHRTVSPYLIGILPAYQRKGINAIIFDEIHKTLHKRNIRFVETNPALEENKAMLSLWKHFDHQVIKRRRTYTKEL